MTICDIIILYIMSCSNDINPETLVKKYKKKHFTEININNTTQDMLFTKYVKYNGGRESPTVSTSNCEKGNKIFSFTNVLEYLDHEENEFIIPTNMNNHYYYKTKEDKKDNLDNRNR
jgi:hypothetical protein